MSIFSNVTEQDLINLRNLADQQKNQRALKIKNKRTLKQTHDIKITESLSPITKEFDESTKKISEDFKEPNSEDDIKSNMKALPNSSKISNSMREMIGSLMNSRNSLKITQDDLRRANILGVPIQISEADTKKSIENIYDLTPEIYKALSSTTYTGKTIINADDILRMYKIIGELGYTGIGDRTSNQKTFITTRLPKLVEEFQNKTFDEITDDSDDLQGERIKIIIPSNIIDIYTGLEVLLGLKISGHTDTLTEAKTLIDELYKRGEIQNEQKHRNALDKTSTI